MVINIYFTRDCYQLKALHVHITDLSPGMTIGNMDTTGLRWLSSFFNTPADEKDNCDQFKVKANNGKGFRLVRMVSIQRVTNIDMTFTTDNFVQILGNLQESGNKRSSKENKRHNTPVLKVGGLKTIALSPTDTLDKLCIMEDSRRSQVTSDPSSCKLVLYSVIAF